MRYVIQCVDNTFKTVTEEEGKKALLSWAEGRPIVVRGAGLASHYISAIKPMKEWWEQQQVKASEKGKYFCEYGHYHPFSEKCTCYNVKNSLLEDTNIPRIAPPKPEPIEEPQTEEQKQKAAAYFQMRSKFLQSRSA